MRVTKFTIFVGK